MRRRRRVILGLVVLLTLGLVPLLTAGVFVARSQGYLGGRDHGGPIDTGGGGGLGLPAAPGQVVVWDQFFLDATGVTIESIEVVHMSPGLEHVGARVITPGQESAIGGVGWPPEERSVEASGATLAGAPGPGETGERLAVGLRVPAPGVYYAQDLRVRYRKGRRRYEGLLGGDLRVCAGPEPACSLSAYKPSTDRGLVFAGGYVDVRRGAMRDDDSRLDSALGFIEDESEEGEIQLSRRAREEFAVALTLLNTGDDVEVEELRLLHPDVHRYARQLGADVATQSGVPARPVFSPLKPFRLRHGEARAIRIRGKRGSCAGLLPGSGVGPVLVAVTHRGEDQVEGANFSLKVPRPCG